MAFNTDPYEYSNKPHNFFKSNFYGKQGLGASNPDYTYTQNNFNDYETKKAQPKPEPMATKKGLKERAANVKKGFKGFVNSPGAMMGAYYGYQGEDGSLGQALADAAIGYGIEKTLEKGYEKAKNFSKNPKSAKEIGKNVLKSAKNIKVPTGLPLTPSATTLGTLGLVTMGNDLMQGEDSMLMASGDMLLQNAKRGLGYKEDIGRENAAGEKMAHWINNLRDTLPLVGSFIPEQPILSDIQKQIQAEDINFAANRLNKNKEQLAKQLGETLPAQQKTNEKAPAATTEQQQAAQSPAASWPEERARLAKEMQDSVKANPNDPSKWKVPQGWGAVRGSDGEMRYEIPDQPFDPVKAREEEMIARAQVDYDTAKSYAMSPYSSPSFRAAQLDIMEQLKRDYPGIGQQQGGGGLIVANGRAGLRGGSNAIDPAMKLALEQQEQAAKNEMEATKNAIADAELLVKEEPVGQAEAKIRALELPSTYGLANPLDPYALNDRRRFYLANEVVNQGLRKDNILDYEATNVRKDLPTLKNMTNSITNNLFGTEFFDDEYMVGDNVIDQSNYSPAIRRQLDSSDAYNQYVNATRARGEQPMTYAEWQDWLRYQSMYRGF